MWIKNFVNELKAWIIVRRVYNENKDDFEKMKVHMDWGGKLYTVINRDTEIELGSEEDRVYFENDLAKLWQLCIKHNIADIVSFQWKPLEDEWAVDDNHIEYEHGYLIIITPTWNSKKQYVNWKSLLFIFLTICAIISGIVYTILRYV